MMSETRKKSKKGAARILPTVTAIKQHKPLYERPYYLRNLQDNAKLAKDIRLLKKRYIRDGADPDLINMCDPVADKLLKCGREVLVDERGLTSQRYRCGQNGLCHSCSFKISKSRVKAAASSAYLWATHNARYDGRLLHATVHIPVHTNDFDLAYKAMQIARAEYTIMMQDENRPQVNRLKYAYAVCGYHFGWDELAQCIQPHLHFVFAVENCPGYSRVSRAKIRNRVIRWPYYNRIIFKKITYLLRNDKTFTRDNRVSNKFKKMASRRYGIDFEDINPFVTTHDAFYEPMSDTQIVRNRDYMCHGLVPKTCLTTLAYIARQPTHNKLIKGRDAKKERLNLVDFLIRRKEYIRTMRRRTSFVIKGNCQAHELPELLKIAGSHRTNKLKVGHEVKTYNRATGKFE